MRQQQSVSDDKQTLAGKAAAADTIVEQELSSGQTSNRDKANSDYFLHALYCVILGVVVMIVLFFICKFLNDCQIDPKMRLRGFGREDLLESLPLILDGHMQVRWKMVPTYNCIFIKVLFVPMMFCRCLLWFCFPACESTCPSKYMIHLASRAFSFYWTLQGSHKFVLASFQERIYQLGCCHFVCLLMSQFFGIQGIIKLGKSIWVACSTVKPWDAHSAVKPWDAHFILELKDQSKPFFWEIVHQIDKESKSIYHESSLKCHHGICLHAPRKPF